MADEKVMAVDQLSAEASKSALWFNYRRQSVPRLISDYACIRVSREFTGAARSVVINSSGTLAPDNMEWHQLNCLPSDFRLSLTGTNLQSQLLKQFNLFRIRCLKWTLVPFGVEPHVNAVRLNTVCMYPTQPFDRLTANVYNPGIPTEYPTWRDLKDADEHLVSVCNASDRTIEINYIPQTCTQTSVIGPAGVQNYEPIQTPWLAPNAGALSLLHVAPWIGFRIPYSTGGVMEVARYTVYQDAIIEYKEAVGNQTD